MRRLMQPGLSFLEKISQRSYGEIFSIWLLIILGFGWLYFLLTVMYPEHGISVKPEWSIIYKFLDSLYFSTVTATTVGYGDLIPLGFSKALAATEAAIGFGTFGLFVSKLIAENQMKLQEQKGEKKSPRSPKKPRKPKS